MEGCGAATYSLPTFAKMSCHQSTVRSGASLCYDLAGRKGRTEDHSCEQTPKNNHALAMAALPPAALLQPRHRDGPYAEAVHSCVPAAGSS